MKYAFVIGTSAFIVPTGVISYADSESLKEILKVRSIYHDNKPGSALSIDLDIKDTHGNPVKVYDNKAESSAGLTVNVERNKVKVFAADGSLLIHVHQLDDESAMSLEHNITAELEVNSPIVVLRINGDFMVEDLHIICENEKLYINDDGYATSALVGNSLRFTAAGVVL
jgi:hypothetical protein